MPSSNGHRNLQHTRVSPLYAARLARGLQCLIFWWNTLGHKTHTLDVSSGRGVAEALVSFIQWCYESKVQHYVAKHAVLSIQMRFPHLKGRLGLAWQSMKSWSYELPLQNRLPLPRLFQSALFCSSLLAGFAEDSPAESYRWLCFAVLFLAIGFEGLLRPKEIFQLTRGALRFDHSGKPRLILLIREPKNMYFLGRIQHALILCPSTVAWASWLFGGLSADSLLWPFSQQAARQCLQILTHRRGLGACGITLGSLRAGKATELYSERLSVPDLMFAGRWKSLNSLQCYIQEAMALLVLMGLPPAAEAQLEEFVASLSCLRWPPGPAAPHPLHDATLRGRLACQGQGLAHRLRSAGRVRTQAWGA